VQKNDVKKITDDQTPEVFAPKKDQKGLSEGIWTKRLPDTGAIIIDLGCGWNKLIPPRKGDMVLGVDHVSNNVVDIRCDLNERLPFEDNSVDAVFSRHCIEHIRDKDRVFWEIHRVLKPGCIAFIKVPHFRAIQAVNYDHFTRWASFSMNTFVNANWYSANFPYFEIIKIGIKWRPKSGWFSGIIDWFINKSFTLSETWLWYPLGGIYECQYLIRKPGYQDL
jgi:predicted SAM-dependent methyltransferase